MKTFLGIINSLLFIFACLVTLMWLENFKDLKPNPKEIFLPIGVILGVTVGFIGGINSSLKDKSNISDSTCQIVGGILFGGLVGATVGAALLFMWPIAVWGVICWTLIAWYDEYEKDYAVNKITRDIEIFA